MKKSQPAPLQKKKPGPSCSNVDSDFPELTVHLKSQYELNGLVKILNLSIIQAEFLASRLQSWNL